MKREICKPQWASKKNFEVLFTRAGLTPNIITLKWYYDNLTIFLSIGQGKLIKVQCNVHFLSFESSPWLAKKPLAKKSQIMVQ